MIVDAGIGTASDATIAMELGCDGVLVNSAIANAKNPILMAKAFKDAVISGRKAFLAGRMKRIFLQKLAHRLKELSNFFFLLTHKVLRFFYFLIFFFFFNFF